MITASTNPFRPTRWEHHATGRPLIWFTDAAERLAAEKPVFVHGSRGSGKTTLLKSICWEDLVRNPSLRMQRKLSDFASIGVYLRFSDHLSKNAASVDWAVLYPKAIDATDEFHRFFSLAVELACSEKILEACHELRMEQELIIAPGQELQIVGNFVAEFAEFRYFSDSPIRSFLDLGRVCRLIVRRMNEACGRGSVDSLDRLLPVREPYQLLNYLVERLVPSIALRGRGTGKEDGRAASVGFKICLDDCEILGPSQQRSLNTLVRQSRYPLSWVVSSVGHSQEYTETFLPAQPLTDADRAIISLDRQGGSDFREFCEAVVGLRLAFSLEQSSSVVRPPSIQKNTGGKRQVASPFRLINRLGKVDVNDIMAQIATGSKRPLSDLLLNGAERLQAALTRNAARRSHQSLPASSLPLYQAYLLMHWRGEGEAFNASAGPDAHKAVGLYAQRLKDGGFNAWLRRKQVAALLHFAASLGVRKIPLGGEGIAIWLADGSIRDFLEIMAEIYDAFAGVRNGARSDRANLERFVGSTEKISAAVQTEGLYRASESYFEGISNRSDLDSDVVARFVEGLGHFTSILQSSPSDSTVLGRAERGIFYTDLSVAKSEGARARDVATIASLLRQAELAGYIRLVEMPRATGPTIDRREPDSVRAFRLHRRFAPYFQFSYRGAYEAVALDVDEIVLLCIRHIGQSPRAWAEALSKRSAKFIPGQLALPLDESATDDQ